MIIFFIISLIFIGSLAYAFIPPKHLKDIPTVPVLPYILSFFLQEPLDKRNERLVNPLLHKYGIVKIWLNRWIVLISDLELSKDFLNNTSDYSKDIFLTTSPYSMFKRFFGSNIVYSDGEEWKRHRSVINPAFHRSWSTSIVGECCEALLDILSKEDKAVEVLPLLKNMTLDALGNAIFNHNFNALKNPKGEQVARYSRISKELYNPFFLTLPILDNPLFNFRGSTVEDINTFRRAIKEIIDKKKNILKASKSIEDKDMDLLTMIVKASLDSKFDESKLSEEEMINNVVMFFTAGQDTTANTLAFALYYLSVNPEIQEKARQEVKKVMKRNKGIPSHDQLKSFEYLKAIIYEVMRIKPTVDMALRTTCQPVEAAPGKILPAGIHIGTSTFGMMYDPKHWENPQLFNPDRFLKYQINKDGEESLFFDKSSTKAWYAFGGGPRSCIGANFSLMEQKIMLSMVLDRFALSLPNDSPHIKAPICSSVAPCYPVNLKINFTEL